MNVYYFIAQRLGNVQKASFSSIITRIAIASIAIGMVFTIVPFAILIGFKSNIQNKLFSFSGHMLITKRGLNNSYEDTPLSTNTYLYKNYDKIPAIASLNIYAKKTGIIKTNDEVLGVVIKGVGAEYDSSFFIPNLIEGSFINFPEKGYSREVVISKKIADKLHLSLKDTLLMFFIQEQPRFRKLVVKGIYQTGMEAFDEKLIMGDINLIRRLNNWADTTAGGYEIRVTDFPALTEEGIPQVLEAMDYDMGLEPITNRHLDIFDWLGLLNKNVAIFLVLIMTVASFNMVSILLIMIMERVQTIGVLKAMGASNWQIRKVFIYKGMLITLKGMGLGNLIGLGFCAIQYYLKVIPLDTNNYYMDTVPIEWNWLTILGLNLMTFLIISIVLILPTVIITRLKPVKAIRFD